LKRLQILALKNRGRKNESMRKNARASKRKGKQEGERESRYKLIIRSDRGVMACVQHCRLAHSAL
ncbi:MAG: hypothetical protein ACK56F_12345, partial [bacterium]